MIPTPSATSGRLRISRRSRRANDVVPGSGSDGELGGQLVRAHVMRIRGSISPYRTSTMKLSTM